MSRLKKAEKKYGTQMNSVPKFAHTRQASQDAIFGGNGKVVGVIIDDTFHKRVYASKHFLRKPPAIAFDKSSIEEAVKKGANKIMIHDKESKKRYQTSMSDFNEGSFEFDRGFGKQVGLSIDKWSILDPNQIKLFNS